MGEDTEEKLVVGGDTEEKVVMGGDTDAEEKLDVGDEGNDKAIVFWADVMLGRGDVDALVVETTEILVEVVVMVMDSVTVGATGVGVAGINRTVTGVGVVEAAILGPADKLVAEGLLLFCGFDSLALSDGKLIIETEEERVVGPSDTSGM